jgi:hypothetical protein
MVRTFANRAVGSQTGSGGYDDAYAYLSGFGPNQEAQATLWKDPAIGNNSMTCRILRRLIWGQLRGNYCAGPGTHEVELLLRWQIPQPVLAATNVIWLGMANTPR